MRVKKPMSAWAMPLVAVVILLLTGAVLVALWLWVNRQTWTDPEKRTLAQLDVVKVASGIALGGGGLFTLYLAARRQRTQEEAQADLNADAEARRITELYAKAVQQLGDAKAPVRLGGLYALERLGQREPETRRTIINVLCAYLRMSYNPPPEKTVQRTGGVPRPLQRNSRRRAGIKPPDGPSAVADLVEARLELDVRLTAQRILAAHLWPHNSSAYWGEHEIDLTGAVLVDLDLDGCSVDRARFDKATFIGEASLRAVFGRRASFDGASFTGDAFFFDASFEGGASFSGASFSGIAMFSDVSFKGQAAFADTIFRKTANFEETSFEEDAEFQRASFARQAWFRNASFEDEAFFHRTLFGGVTMFAGASFNVAQFGEATFTSITTFAEAVFSDDDSAVVRTGLEESWVQVNPRTVDSDWPTGWQISSSAVGRPGHSGEWAHLTQDE
jgi:uncharacterized protein YjbI with pentapeptide repeats